MTTAVSSWTKKKADELSAVSKTKRSKFNTASTVYDEESGKYFYGRNRGIELSGSKKNPKLFGKDGVLPKQSLNIYPVGNCSEVDAINNALNSGAKLENLTLLTVHTHKEGFGKPKIACENCTYAFKGKIKHNHSGWKEN